MAETNGGDKTGKLQWFTTIVIVVVGFAVSWGTQKSQSDEVIRRVGVLEEKVDNRLMTKDEFEKRHGEIERRVEILERYRDDRIQEDLDDAAGYRKSHPRRP